MVTDLALIVATAGEKSPFLGEFNLQSRILDLCICVLLFEITTDLGNIVLVAR